ncbi:MAG: TrkH family potassium uptake protein [Pseudomonadota bacterium]
MKIRPVLLAVGIMTALLGFAMIPCAAIDIADGRSEWPVFAISAFFSILIGAVLYLLSQGGEAETGQREAFVLTVLVWLVLPAVAAIPFVFSGYRLTDSVFESVSGLTTTGATVFTGLDEMPRGLLLWRAILQWFGGIGIIVTAIAILPQLRVGGMQLFQLESSDVAGKFLPRVREIATQTGLVYVILSALCALLYIVTGMAPFDAVAHSMTTVAAGGFSTHDTSFVGYQGTPVIWVAIVFMFLAGLPFSLLALALLNGRPLPLFTDPQPRLYLALAAGISALIAIVLAAQPAAADVDAPMIVFNVLSVMTGTGYASAEYDAWGNGVAALFLITIFLGGCAGSAACGIKMFRLEISAKAVVAHAQRMVSPSRVASVRYAGRVVDEDTLQSVVVFVFLYLATFLVAAALLGLAGEDTMTAMSAAAASVSNVGPGLGAEVGPYGNFQGLSDASKWICLSAMLLGRLEFVAVFVVLAPRFWRG